jgi:hydroxymethylpyrimidine/phosphomethylpyrimidine kinase
MRKILLTVAGFDPSAGAGVLLDLKVFGRFGFHGTALVTAITTQNTLTVKNVYPLSARLLKEQHRILSGDLTFAGIKVGMAGSRENLEAAGKVLAAHKDIPKVVDPIIRSSSGKWFLAKSAAPEYLRAIKKKASVITPNLNEAGWMIHGRVRSLAEMKDAARTIYDVAHVPCLITGGHLEKEVVNLLYDGRRIYLFGGEKINKDVHGTGCFFSACLLCSLAKRKPLVRACELATELTRRELQKATRLGRGRHIFGNI